MSRVKIIFYEGSAEMNIITACKEIIKTEFSDGINLDDTLSFEGMMEKVRIQFPDVVIPDTYDYLIKRLRKELFLSRFGQYYVKSPESKEVVHNSNKRDSDCIHRECYNGLKQNSYSCVHRLYYFLTLKYPRILQEKGILAEKDLLSYLMISYPFDLSIQYPHILEYEPRLGYQDHLSNTIKNMLRINTIEQLAEKYMWSEEERRKIELLLI